MIKKSLFLLLFVAATVVRAAITTPYPEVIELKQINGAEKERVRLCQGHKKYERQPTGFYIAAGKTVEVNVEILTAADMNVMPTLIVGTMGFNVEGRNTGTVFTLKEGTNTITGHSGGLVWLSFIQSDSPEPKGLARISFTSGSEHVRAPRYVYGVTTDLEFYEMWNTYDTPDVLYHSDYIVVTATRDAARLYSYTNREGTVLQEWMDAIHTLLEKEDEISGMDNSDPNPVHHRLKVGEVRFVLTENTSASPHASSGGYTGYPYGSRHRYLTKIGVSGNNSWMLGHELGHQHQQPAYMINKATESTVNIYSYVVERNIQGAGYQRTSTTRWSQAQNSYLSLPVSKRIYDMEDDQLEGIVGFNRDELRFMVWEQFFWMFGDPFYKTLHRVVREEKIYTGSADERRACLIWKASQVSGYDLTEFFNQWGIRVTEADIKAKLRARMANALANGAIVPLPVPVEECVMLTGQNPPSWAPLPLKGITTSMPENEVEPISRSGWTITTSIEGPADGAVGGDKAVYIIDGNTSTAFAFVKPGMSYGGISTPADHVPSFTIDMQEVKTFNYVSYMHRFLNNTLERLRARQFSVYGSNNNVDFTPIYKNYEIDYVKNSNEVIVEFPAVSYRYVRVEIEDWDKTQGSTVQVAEFNVGTKAPAENLPVPAPLQFQVNVKTDDKILTSQAGVNLVDEDSDYTVRFSLAAGVEGAVVTIDGDEVTPVKDGDTYSLTVKVTNHLDIDLSAASGSGLDSQSARAHIRVSPNPVKAGQPFTVSLGDEFADATVGVYAISGEKLFEQKANGDTDEWVIDKAGMYIIEVKKNHTKRVFKLIVV